VAFIALGALLGDTPLLREPLPPGNVGHAPSGLGLKNVRSIVLIGIGPSSNAGLPPPKSKLRSNANDRHTRPNKLQELMLLI
jgi:hypothetical protein